MHPIHVIYSNGRDVADQCVSIIVVLLVDLEVRRPMDSSLLLFRKYNHSFFLRSVDGIGVVGTHRRLIMLWSYVCGACCDESQLNQNGVRPFFDLPKDDLIIGHGSSWACILSTHCSRR